MSTSVGAWPQLVCDCVQALVHGLRESVVVYKCWCMVSLNMCAYNCLHVSVYGLREYVIVYKHWCMVSVSLWLSTSVGAWSH